MSIYSATTPLARICILALVKTEGCITEIIVISYNR